MKQTQAMLKSMLRNINEHESAKEQTH